ncbi:MAG: hypothetical protein QM811_08150 [Pirellulales bacterium]
MRKWSRSLAQIAAAPDAYDRIMAKLNEPSTLEFQEARLEDVVEFLAKKHDLPVQVDVKALEEAAFDTATPITLRTTKLPLRHALRLLLRDKSLAYVVDNDSLILTSRVAMENTQTVRAYSVGDLIEEVDGEADFASFIEMAQSLIQPNTWKANGGQGDCVVYRGRVFLASNTQEVHEELADFLTKLRNAERESASLRTKTSESRKPNEQSIVRRVYPLFVKPEQAPQPTNDDKKVGALETSPGAPHILAQLGGLPYPPGYVPRTATVCPVKTAALVKQVVLPKSWNDGQAAVYPGPQCIVVVQTIAGQREVLRFLTELNVLALDHRRSLGLGGSCMQGVGSMF